MDEVPLETWGATDAEIVSSMPGDDLIDQPGMSATRSIDLDAAPQEVFAWIAQMGFGRAGWYSYDLIDNLGRRSARERRPEWMVQRAGDEMPAGPISFTVTHLARPDHLVIAVLDRRAAGHRIDFTLAYRLDTAGDSNRPTTRLVTRARAAITGPLGAPAGLAIRLGDGIMVRRQLLGLRERCADSDQAAGRRRRKWSITRS